MMLVQKDCVDLRSVAIVNGCAKGTEAEQL
jgi:hypothetical protein